MKLSKSLHLTASLAVLLAPCLTVTAEEFNTPAKSQAEAMTQGGGALDAGYDGANGAGGATGYSEARRPSIDLHARAAPKEGAEEEETGSGPGAGGGGLSFGKLAMTTAGVLLGVWAAPWLLGWVGLHAGVTGVIGGLLGGFAGYKLSGFLPF